MTVGPMSRYNAGDAAIVVAADGTERVVVPARFGHRQPSEVAYHVVNEGDTFETLAHHYLGSSKLWWHIADANPLTFPLALEVGLTVLVPISGARRGPTRTRSW